MEDWERDLLNHYATEEEEARWEQQEKAKLAEEEAEEKAKQEAEERQEKNPRKKDLNEQVKDLFARDLPFEEHNAELKKIIEAEAALKRKKYRKTNLKFGDFVHELTSLEHYGFKKDTTRIRKEEDFGVPVQFFNWEEAVMKQREREEMEKLKEEEEKELVDNYDGPTEIIAVNKKKDEEILGTFGEMQRRLKAETKKQFEESQRRMNSAPGTFARMIRDARDGVEDRIEEARDNIEVSQNPLFEKMRDVNDFFFNETEEGWAKGQLYKHDPGFDLPDFLEEMEWYTVPIVAKEFLKRNIWAMELACTEQGLRQVQAHWAKWDAEREHEIMDEQYLVTQDLNFHSVLMFEDEPHINFTFIGAQKKRKIVAGRWKMVNVTVTYNWVMKRDFKAEWFGWRIVEWQMLELNLLS